MSERATSQKSADAYRTISEVADDLILPQHVLRFWETRFPQVKPLKRAGGRRFYRPEDVELLRAVKTLLYADGYTIKGVQRMLREQGPRSLAALAGDSTSRGTSDAPFGATPTTTIDLRQPSFDDQPSSAPEPHRNLNGVVECGTVQHPEYGGDLPRLRRTDLVGRLQAVLSELAECERVLASTVG